MNRLSITITFMFVLFAFGCEVEAPIREDVPELITQVTLTFTPAVGDPVVVTATDPDGEGVQDVQVDGDINLEAMKTYNLSLTLTNGLAAPSDPEYDVTEEVEEEGHEHLFYFSWTNDVFSDPSGDGNLDSRSDPINYDDEDVNGLPLGLQTTWTTAAAASGDFRVVLKHQPELKSATSESTVGETDVDITFTVNVE
ncbi:MAG TPA: hypothetical protein VEW65_01240 [Chryseolinea sp.]|nr:hypothetical protein [Chryseolinea sp.]